MTNKIKSDSLDIKSLSEDFIHSLGLVELIIGSIGLYWVYLWYQHPSYGGELADLFPSTGVQLIDFGLLAFAAAFTGKFIWLLVATMMAFGRLIVRKLELPYYIDIKHALCSYHKVEDIQSLKDELNQRRINVIDKSANYIIQNNPNQQIWLEKIIRRTIIAYSISLLAIPYSFYFDRSDAPELITWATFISMLVFLVIGFFEQLVYFSTIAEMLTAINIDNKKASNVNF